MDIIREIVSRKNLLWELILKDLKLRYARLGLGFFWAFLSPLLIVAIFYFIFSFLLKIDTPEAPFVLYLMSAIFPWMMLQDSVVSSVDCLMSNKNLLRESRFPHYFIPLSKVLANALNFIPGLTITLIVSVFILRGSSEFIIFLPLALLIHLILAFALALIFSIIYLKFRDIKYIVEHLFMILFYLSPVFYSLSLVKATLAKPLFLLYINNPFTGLLFLYRTVLLKGYFGFLYKDAGLTALFFVPVIFSAVILYAALKLYERNKDKINDYLSY